MADAETGERATARGGEPDSDPSPDPEAVRRAIRARGESIRRSELERAFDRLDAQGDFSDADRRVVARMAAAVVDGVLAAPETALSDASRADADAVRAVANLFAPER